MLDSKRNNSDAPREKSEEAKRTTIILEKSEREFIESLIKEGKEAGIKPLISKMLDIYKSMMVYDWHFPGEYYCGISRTAFVNVELLNILTQQIPKEKWPEVGEKMGDALKVSIQSTLGVVFALLAAALEVKTKDRAGPARQQFLCQCMARV